MAVELRLAGLCAAQGGAWTVPWGPGLAGLAGRFEARGGVRTKRRRAVAGLAWELWLLGEADEDSESRRQLRQSLQELARLGLLCASRQQEELDRRGSVSQWLDSLRCLVCSGLQRSAGGASEESEAQWLASWLSRLSRCRAWVLGLRQRRSRSGLSKVRSHAEGTWKGLEAGCVSGFGARLTKNAVGGF